MGQLFSDQSTTQLREIKIPGSHDSGTWPVTSSSEVLKNCTSKTTDQWAADASTTATANWAKTQTDSAYSQATAGVRYFDLRVVNEKEPVTCHTMEGASIKQVFGTSSDKGLNSFIAENPKEIIILDFQKMWGDTANTAAVMQNVNMFQTDVCPHAVQPGPNSIPGELTVSAVRTAGKNYIVLVDPAWEKKLRDQGVTCFWPGTQVNIKRDYADGGEYNLWEAIQESENGKKPNAIAETRQRTEDYLFNAANPMRGFQVTQYIWTYGGTGQLTATASIPKNTRLLDYANRDLNPYFTKFYERMSANDRHTNVFIQDAVSSPANYTSLLLEENQKLFG